MSFLAKCPFGETSFRQNGFGKMVFGEITFGGLSGYPAKLYFLSFSFLKEMILFLMKSFIMALNLTVHLIILTLLMKNGTMMKKIMRQRNYSQRDIKKYICIKSTPDGNCLFNSASLIVFGNEAFNIQLRLDICTVLFITTNF
jgi:hypothetical protein